MPGFEDDILGEQPRPLLGMYLGVVTDNQDPEGLYRVKIEIPGLIEPQSGWAFPLSGFGGGSRHRGLFSAPRVGAEVAVWFVNGDPDQPWYTAAHWGKPDGESEVPEEASDPDISVISTETFRLILNEKPGERKLRIVNLKTDDYIEFDAEQNIIELSATTSLTLKALGIVDIEGTQIRLNGRVVQPTTDVI